MSDTWIRRTAWVSAIAVIATLISSAVILFLAPHPSNANWLANQVASIVTLSAPILGLIILMRQPRHRIGWLWIIYGLFVAIRSLGHAIYYFGGSQFAGYSALEYFFLWSTEPANLATLICYILLILWFPDGHLLSRRWRILYAWMFPAVIILSLSLFTAGSNWNGGVSAGGIVIENPYGFLPDNYPFNIGFLAFISIILIMLLAVVSQVLRYRSAGQLVRLQLRWFVLGGFIFIALVWNPLLDGVNPIESNFTRLLFLLNQSAILALYAAVGIAILRYRLYDIDVIIRRTVQYAVLTVILALIYIGSVLLLQSLVETFTGEKSPIVIVFTTLVIAALFNPLRIRIQDFIDRRFYRKKYNAEHALAQFAAAARDEVDLDKLNAALLGVIEETMQPVKVGLLMMNMSKDR